MMVIRQQVTVKLGNGTEISGNYKSQYDFVSHNYYTFL